MTKPRNPRAGTGAAILATSEGAARAAEFASVLVLAHRSSGSITMYTPKRALAMNVSNDVPFTLRSAARALASVEQRVERIMEAFRVDGVPGAQRAKWAYIEVAFDVRKIPARQREFLATARKPTDAERERNRLGFAVTRERGVIEGYLRLPLPLVSRESSVKMAEVILDLGASDGLRGVRLGHVSGSVPNGFRPAAKGSAADDMGLGALIGAIDPAALLGNVNAALRASMQEFDAALVANADPQTWHATDANAPSIARNWATHASQEVWRQYAEILVRRTDEDIAKDAITEVASALTRLRELDQRGQPGGVAEQLLRDYLASL